jgi:hypothetical protein
LIVSSTHWCISHRATMIRAQRSRAQEHHATTTTTTTPIRATLEIG